MASHATDQVLESERASPSSFPADYLERVYAGVLGKLIGVYVGRPFENWTHQRIISELGPITGHLNKRLGVPCVVTDDDVSGTFGFVRAIEEHGNGLTSEKIGKTWLNQIVEKQSVFWWGGRGISTEHTAFLNLKEGIPAPRSGSIATNGKTVAEQIGAQIFIDGWAMIAPGRPEVAANLAEMAGKVSHDGESVYAATLWAAMESQAFVSSDIDHLLDLGLSFIPKNCEIATGIADVRTWVKADEDWMTTRQRIEDHYGYDKFKGVCHVMPNHLIMVMSVLYASHDFDLAMMIVNTCGWDTDCNSGNVGCLVAIMNGMKSFEGKVDWRGPVSDRALISTADSGYSINNAARLAIDLVNSGRRLAGEDPLPAFKDGAQFHFTLPGSVQGFASPRGLGQADDALLIAVHGETTALTPTHADSDLFQMGSSYPLSSSPLVYPGQRVYARLRADTDTKAQFCLQYYDHEETLVSVYSEDPVLLPESRAMMAMSWTLPPISETRPIAFLGLSLTSNRKGTVWLDRFGWSGTPNMIIQRPKQGSARFWDLQWILGVTDYRDLGETVCIANDCGQGIVSYGNRDWHDYKLTVIDFCPKLGGPSGPAIRVRGLRRWYALLFGAQGVVSLVKMLDGELIVLASLHFEWHLDGMYEIELEARGNRITGRVGGLSASAQDDQYISGGLGFVVDSGALSAGPIRVEPVAPDSLEARPIR